MHHTINEYQLRLDVQHFLWPVYYIVILRGSSCILGCNQETDICVVSEQQHCPFSVSGAQLQSSVERPCPGESVTFTCTVPSRSHQWRVPSLSITRIISPVQQSAAAPPFQFAATEVVPGVNITSTVTVNATTDLNGTLVVCQDGLGILPDNQNSTITLIGEHGVIVCLHT